MQLGVMVPPRPFVRSVTLVVATLLLGLAIRFAPLGLSWSVRKYGGSVLWAAMLYWVVSTLLGHLRPPVAAAITEVIAVAVEFFKRVHTPELDRFRSTLAGVLLLGRSFSYADILAYTAAIACVFCMDLLWLRHRNGS